MIQAHFPSAKTHFVSSPQGELSQRKALVGRLAITLQGEFGIPRHPEAPGIERSQMKLSGRVLGGSGAFKPGDRPLLVLRDSQPLRVQVAETALGPHVAASAALSNHFAASLASFGTPTPFKYSSPRDRWAAGRP